jgi:hypothetical protein
MAAVAAKPAMEADPAKKFRLLEFTIILDLLIFSFFLTFIFIVT